MKTFLRSRIFSWTILTVLICAVIFLFYFRSRANSPRGIIPQDGAMHIRFFDIGQGDATLIVAPDGSDILIDGGTDGRIVEHLGKALLPTDRTLELVVLTHPHADHLNGLLDVLKYYKVKAVMMTGVSHTSHIYNAWLEKIKEEGAKIIYPQKGYSAVYGGMELRVLAPKEDWKGKKPNLAAKSEEGDGLNETSIVLLVDYQDSEVLLMGDAGAETEKEITESMEFSADILKTGHHGSKYSTSPSFVREVKPEIAIISSGAKNKYGHPHYRTLRTLERAGVGIYRTDIDGTINAWSNGADFKLNLERPNRPKSCAEYNFVLKWLQYGCY